MSIKPTSFIKTSSIGQYEGYSDACYDDAQRTSQYYTVSDGTKIAVDYYRPMSGGVVEEKPLPVVFHYTPYGRIASAQEAAKLYGTKGGEPRFDDWGIEGLLDLTRYGYVVAIADVRGTGASYGVRITTNSRREAQDGKEIIEWLAQQPFSTGNVGIAGYSYTGQTTLECISTCPTGLKASFTCMTDFDKYDGWLRGGIPRAFETHPDDFDASNEESIRKMVDKLAATTIPVDDDLDGSQLREACRMHLDNGDQIGIMRDLVHRDSYLEADGEHWKVISISSYKDQLNKSGVAVYCMGGVYDVFRRDTFVMYENLEVPKKLTMGPWYHMDQKFDIRWDIEMRRWFDHWLKGIDNGVDTEQPVNYKLCSYNFDRHATAGADTGSYVGRKNWPVSEGARKVFYPTAAQKLSGSSLDQGALVLECPASEETHGFTDPYGPGCGVECRLTTTDKGNGFDQQGATFTTAALENDLDIVGHPLAHVVFSLDDPGWMEKDFDVDIFVMISDYNPATDECFLITQGQLRVSKRSVEECPYDYLGLPWHPCKEADSQYLDLGTKYAVDIDALPTTYRLQKGHCLRMTLANSCDRMYYYGRFAYEDNADIAKPKVSFYFGGDDPTAVTIPNIYK